MAIFPEPKDYQKFDYSLLLNGLKESVKDLSPAYFAMVVATDIISIAAHLLGRPLVAVAMFWLNIVTRSSSFSQVTCGLPEGRILIRAARGAARGSHLNY